MSQLELSPQKARAWSSNSLSKKESARYLEELAETLRLGQNQLLEMIAKGAPLKDILVRLTLLIEDQSEGVFCSILLLDEDGVHIRSGAGPSLPREYMDALDGFEIGPCVGSCGTAMYRKELVVVSDINLDPLWTPYKDIIAPFGFRACWSSPIFLNKDIVLGTFAMYYRTVRSPEKNDMRLIDCATHLAGIAIERSRRENELSRHRDRLEELVLLRTAQLSDANALVKANNEALNIANSELTSALENLRLTQEKLIQRDKLAALGSLVAGVAHELNTPIGNSLLVASSMFEKSTKFKSQCAQGLTKTSLDEYVRISLRASELLQTNLARAAELVSSFKKISSHEGYGQRKQFQVSNVMARIIAESQEECTRSNVQLHVNIHADPVIDSYADAVHAVVEIILKNCLVHAFKDAAKANIYIDVLSVKKTQLEVCIRDDGVGIAEADIAHVFEPFFTTHLGAGTSGLGLYIAYNIVTGLLCGSIEATSKLKEGTTFTVSLPLEIDAPQAESNRIFA